MTVGFPSAGGHHEVLDVVDRADTAYVDLVDGLDLDPLGKVCHVAVGQDLAGLGHGAEFGGQVHRLADVVVALEQQGIWLLYTSPSPRD